MIMLITILEPIVKFVIEKSVNVFISETHDLHIFVKAISELHTIKSQLKEIINSPFNEALDHFESAMTHMKVGSKDMIKYFDFTIQSTTRCLSFESISLEKCVIMTELKCLSQSFIEENKSVRENIQLNLTKLLKRKSISEMYYKLAFYGCSKDSEEIKVARNIKILFDTLSNLYYLDRNDFITTITHDVQYNKYGGDYHKVYYNPYNPCILIRSTAEKTARVVTTTLVMPMYIGLGIGWSALSILASPFYYANLGMRALKTAIFEKEYLKEIRLNDIKYDAEKYAIEDIGKAVYVPKAVVYKVMNYYEHGKHCVLDDIKEK